MERKPYSGNRSASAQGRQRSAQYSGASQPRSSRPAGRPPQDRYGRPTDMRRPGAPANHSAVRRPPEKRTRRRKRPLKDLIPLVLLLCAVAGIAYFFLSTWITVQVNSSTYCSNVYVNGIKLDSFSKEAGVNAVHQALDRRVNESFTLTSGGQSWSFTPADFDASMNADSFLERAWNIGHAGSLFDKKNAIGDLKNNRVEFNAPVEYNPELIDAFLDPIAEALYIAPVDAQVTLDTDRPYLSGQSATGQELDREAAKAMICELIENGSGETELPLTEIQPAVSSDAAQGGMITIVEFSTDTTFRHTAARKNITKALGYFNAFAVYPGDTVSFNEVVGKRSEERGWFKAAEYVGNTSQDGYGGGVCQASSTLYGAVLRAGMDIISRSSHSMTVSYVDPSLDAAVTDTNYKDFVFQNNTEHAIYIYTHVDREFATVTIYGNRPKYKYEPYSKILRQDAECSLTSYLPDESGKYCYYTNETKIHTEGHPALESEGWLFGYDWETGEEVFRKQLSYDVYESGTNIYWRGIHDPASGEVVDYSKW